MLARNILQITGSLALMFVLNAALTGVLLAVVPIVAIGAVQYGNIMLTYLSPLSSVIFPQRHYNSCIYTQLVNKY